MPDILKTEHPPPAVFEPLLRRLGGADVEVRAISE